MFNQGGFNSLSFSKITVDFEINKEDSINVQAVEENDTEADLNTSDDINITLSEEKGVVEPLVEQDTLTLVTDESIDIYRETSGLDPPIVNIEESTEVNTEIFASDDLNVTDGLYVPYGFNQQGFNQSQELYSVELDSTYLTQYKTASDSLQVDILSTVERDAELFLTEDLNTNINDYNGLSKPESVFDSGIVSLSENSILNVLHSLEDEILVSEREYLPLGFNQQGFNQDTRRYYLETEEIELNTHIVPEDNLLVTIDIGTNYDADVYDVESIDVSLVESRTLDKPDYDTDDLDVSFTESASVEVYIDINDNIDLTYESYIPLGFNGQRFNQDTEYYYDSSENSSIGISQNDSLLLNIENYSYLNTEIVSQDNLDLDSIEQRKWTTADLTALESLEPVLDEQRALNKHEYVQDIIYTNIDDIADLLALISVEDELLVRFISTDRVTSTLMLLKDGIWYRIEKGYVLVNGEWKSIIGYRGVVNGTWKDLKE